MSYIFVEALACELRRNSFVCSMAKVRIITLAIVTASGLPLNCEEAQQPLERNQSPTRVAVTTRDGDSVRAHRRSTADPSATANTVAAATHFALDGSAIAASECATSKRAQTQKQDFGKQTVLQYCNRSQTKLLDWLPAEKTVRLLHVSARQALSIDRSLYTCTFSGTSTSTA